VKHYVVGKNWKWKNREKSVIFIPHEKHFIELVENGEKVAVIPVKKTEE
jgi:hypothetical protein